MKKFLVTFFLLLSSLYATDEAQEAVEYLNGILFVGNWNEVRKTSVDELHCVMAKDVALLRRHPDFVRFLQGEYLGRPITRGLIENLKSTITQFYKDKNQPFVAIIIPKQDFANGSLQVVIEEAKMGKLYVQGNCYFPSRWFADAMRTLPGQPIDAQTVLEDVAWLNLNPFRRTDAIFKPGDQPGVADIELVTIDRWPYRFYAGGDNTGTEPTNRNRLFFGFNFGKSVLKDGQISYQFSCAPNWNLFYSHTASARLPLPWRHVWVLWGGYASVEPSTGLVNHKNQGISWQVDTRYRIPFFIDPAIMQTLVIGYDFKETNNDLLFNGAKTFSANADINQFMFGYELGLRKSEFRLALTAELYFNPGGITYANKSRFYEELRYDAKDRYVYFKLAHSAGTKFPYGFLSYDLMGQASTTNLLPSEQMTMTGYNAVRGFEERILNLDNAALGHLTYETPHWSLAKSFGKRERLDEFYFLAFFDCGIGRNHKPAPGEKTVKSLASAGPGVRWQMDRYFTARFDYGFQLWHKGFSPMGDSRYNFGLMLSY
jgi:hemolysin activation/secretion protein